MKLRPIIRGLFTTMGLLLSATACRTTERPGR